MKDIQVLGGGKLHFAVVVVHGLNTTGERQDMADVQKHRVPKATFKSRFKKP